MVQMSAPFTRIQKMEREQMCVGEMIPTGWGTRVICFYVLLNDTCMHGQWYFEWIKKIQFNSHVQGGKGTPTLLK